MSDPARDPLAGVQIGIDVGGTFTDLVAFDEHGRPLASLKAHSTPGDPSRGVLDALNDFDTIDRERRLVGRVAHGTTIATNTLLEKKGARTCLLTTQGFEDVLELRRHNRPQMYNLFQEIAAPLVPRDLRLGVNERVDSRGEILLPLDEEDVLRALERVRSAGVEAVAICFLHAYANPVHERRAAELVAEEFPDLLVACSHEVWPEYREYERTSTTVLNAYIGPRVGRYLARMSEELDRRGAATFHVMKSNGGLTSAENARRFPVHLIESGPAAGMVAAARLGRDLGFERVIALDVGGTTAKAGLITDGTPKVTTDFYADAVRHGAQTGGYAIKSPVIDLVEIGAGGGSVAWVDPAGVIKVGPRSAGAVPGPACYGLGGTDPTVTDASLVLGHLNPAYFHGGRTRLEPELAVKAVEAKVGRFFGWSPEEAAAAILRIATANMIEVVRLISVRKGHDPREFCLLAYGGAGPLYAGHIAKELDIPQVIIPPAAGLFSALGVLVAGTRHDLVTTRTYVIDELPVGAGTRIFEDLEGRLGEILAREHTDPARAKISRSLDMRYLGQVFEVNIPVEGDLDQKEVITDLGREFERRYKGEYHYALPSSRIEIVNFRLLASIDESEIEISSFDRALRGSAPASTAPPRFRRVYDELRAEFTETRILQGDGMQTGQEIGGPAIVEREDTTVHILAGQTGRLDERGCLVIQAKRAAP